MPAPTSKRLKERKTPQKSIYKFLPAFGIGTLFIAAFLLPLAALAYKNPGAPSGFVNDFAGIISTSERQTLESKLSAFEKSSGNEIVIAIIPSLDGDTVENFAVELFKDWGIGEKGQDNGALLLISRDDRKLRIEVGYGLEGNLTDATSFQIINQTLTPAFKAGKYYDGINAATDQMIAAASGQEEPVPPQTAGTQWSFKSILNLAAIALVLGQFIIIWLSSILARSKSWWAGGAIGGILGGIIWIFTSIIIGIGAIVLLAAIGFVFDYVVSNAFKKHKIAGTRIPWWAGGPWIGGGFGGSGSSGGGFGGFGGGDSGGGGSSGGW